MEVLNNIIVPLLSALIGGFYALWIFNKGLNKKKLEEKSNRIKNNYETEQYFFHNLESILYFIDKQIDEISNTSQKSKNWHEKNLTLALFSELKMTELRELNFKTLYQILVIDREGNTKEKAQDFINIKNCLYNVEDFIIKHQNENKNPHKELEKELIKWNNSLKSFTQIYNHFITQNPSKDDKLIQIMHKYIITTQKELMSKGVDQNMEEFYNAFILPFRNEISAYENLNDQRLIPIVENLMNCYGSYSQTKALRHQRRRSILFSGRRLIQIKQLLKSSMNSIEKRKKRIE